MNFSEINVFYKIDLSVDYMQKDYKKRKLNVKLKMTKQTLFLRSMYEAGFAKHYAVFVL